MAEQDEQVVPSISDVKRKSLIDAVVGVCHAKAGVARANADLVAALAEKDAAVAECAIEAGAWPAEVDPARGLKRQA